MHHGILALVQLVGYPGVAAMVFLESGVPFGFVLPGSSMLFTAGLLSAQQIFSPWILIPLVTLAAVAGDSVGYWFGSYVGVRLFLRPDSRFFKHEYLEDAKQFYDRYGRQAVVLGRFVPIVRTFIPIVAGIVQMPYASFLAYNVVGAIVWAAGVTLAGYWLGNIPIIQQYFSPILIGIVMVSCLPILWKTFRRKAQKA